MKALIYIEVLEELQHQFIKPEFEKIKKEYVDYVFFDFDNFSGDDVITHTKRLCEEAEYVVLFVNCKSEKALLKKFLSLFTFLKQQKEKVNLQLIGKDHAQLTMLERQLNISE